VAWRGNACEPFHVHVPQLSKCWALVSLRFAPRIPSQILTSKLAQTYSATLIRHGSLQLCYHEPVRLSDTGGWRGVLKTMVLIVDAGQSLRLSPGKVCRLRGSGRCDNAGQFC